MTAADVPELPESAWFTKLRRNLRRWYATHARDLPWRRTHDPYRIWISEIMLQQTTVAAVIPYYERFLHRFPDVRSLADADEQDVLKLWEGLGYYSRARNIHKTAKCLVAERNGAFPETADELQKLPGIGRYTAGAIASFAFDTPAPIVEANTLRLYCRLLGFDGDPRSKQGQELLWAFAERCLPRKQPGTLNQGLMELGGTLCSVKEPQCSDCPLRTCCIAFANNLQDKVPRPKQRPEVTQLTHVNVIVRKKNQVLLRQHTDEERWSGLWDFPRYELIDELTNLVPTTTGNSLFSVEPAVSQFLAESISTETGIACDIDEKFLEFSHTVTRYRIRLAVFTATFANGRIQSDTPAVWANQSQVEDLPLSMTARKVAKKFFASK
ncbi:MAG: A/G-specific adenine glycosylase [Planctomycetaceae bacterium]